VQLSLPLGGGLPPSRTRDVWLVVAPDANPAAFVARLASRRHLFVDALDGRCVIGSDDLVLTRAGKPDEYVLLVPSWREACSAWPSTPTVPGCSSSNRHESSEANVEAVAVFLSSNAAPSEDLLAWGTGLEQTLALLRHKGAANLADVRAERSARAVTALEGTAEGTLLGLLERERADALRLL